MTKPIQLSDHFEDPYHRGECESATHVAEISDGSSGCQIRMELAVSADQTISEVWWDGAGCLFCEGFASILAERSEGCSVESLSPEGFLAEVQHDGQHAPSCLSLPLSVFQQAIEQGSIHESDAEAGYFGGPSLGEEC